MFCISPVLAGARGRNTASGSNCESMYNLGNDIYTSDLQVWSPNNRYSKQLLYVVVSKSGRAVARYWLVCHAVVKDATFLRDPSRDSVGPSHHCAIHPSTHVREGPAQVDFCSARNLVYIWSVVCVYTSTRKSVGRSVTAPPPMCYYCPAYSSASFVSLRFHSCKDKSGALFRNII